jgi:hypothetical protein
MTDKNGVPVTAGARCKYFFELRNEWIEGTVRHTRMMSYYNNFEQRMDVWEAKVDDGDPANLDPYHNGCRTSAWVVSEELEVLP